jgi:hypothetical protein
MIFLDADKIKAALQFALTYGPGKEEGCQEILDALGDAERVCVMSDGEVGALEDLLQITADLSRDGEDSWTELERGLSEAFKAELSHRKG